MQNTVKIALFLLPLFIFSCDDRIKNNKFKYFEYYSINSDSIVLVDSKIIKHFRDNLYFKNDTLSIGVSLYEDKLNAYENTIVSKFKGILFFNTELYNISIDTNSYRFLIKDLIAIDSKHIIAFPKGKYKLPFFQMLRLDPKKTKIFDKNNTYLIDDSLIYCIPTNSYIDIKPSEFIVVEIDGVIYGRTKENYYYLDEHITTIPKKKNTE
ncbi:MAG TPA: hypothetical protein VK169_14530 [Saprospiraceae bacterium]|nr:hypothetical protein [Saprospiraceae bacterium]